MKYTFQELVILKQLRVKRSHEKMPENVGLDTETYKGKVKLITDSNGRYKFIESFEDIMHFLTFYKFRNSFNWFFNIQFDFESIIKHLEKYQLLELYENGSIDIGTGNNYYKISYLSGKVFSISEKIKGKTSHSYVFYDINNFLETSLNNASKKYLNKEKLDIINPEKLNMDLSYWEENKEDIIKYCIQDAILTKEIADYFWNIMRNTLNFNPNKPYSKGRFSEEYFLKKCYIPTVNNIDRKILEYAYNSYYGGRFEIIKKGYFEKVYMYDIKSAYPSIMANLIDINKGKWRKTKSFQPDAYYGFYKCVITFFHPVISPFMQKIKGLNIYPNGIFYQYLTQHEINFIRQYFKNADIKIIDGYVFYPDALFYPLREEIEKLYEWKEKESDEDIKYCIKIVLNSLYGKFIQTVGGNTGKMFNPIWASIITSDTRLKLLKLSLPEIRNTIGFSTDSIHSEKPLNIKWEKENGLGEFELKFKGEGIYIMSDIYTVWNNDKTKSKFRGFQMIGQNNKELKYNLKDILQNINGSKYSYTVKRPIHLGEALREIELKKLQRKISVDDINIFTEISKNMDINGDKKRLWDKEVSDGKELLDTHISSKPLALITE